MMGFAMSWKSGCAVTASSLAVFVVIGTNPDAMVQQAWAGAPSSVATAAVTPAARKRAQDRFAKARQLYKSGKYRASIEELQTAIELDPTGAEMVYNLGLLHEKLAEVDKAIAAYRHYVEMIDDAADKARVEGIIERLEGARADIAAPAASTSASPAQTQPTAPMASAASSTPVEVAPTPESGRLDGWVIASGAVAVAGLAIGITFGAKALSDRVQGVPTTSEAAGEGYADLQDRKDRAQREALIADVGFGVAVAAGIAGAVLYFARDSESNPSSTASTRLSPSIALSPTGALAGLRFGF
jgi:tetratricopeptide (TPR) repeat protein